MKQPKKGRLWLNDGSCLRLKPERCNHVWSYDFVHCRTDDGKAFRTLNILDEFSRECLAIRVRRKLNSTDVIDALTDLFILRGPPAYIRSDNGPEFVAADDGRYADAAFNLAKLEFDTGHPAEAGLWWSRYLELDRDSEWAQRARNGLRLIAMQAALENG
jgi:transposase InsO family protein